MSIPLQALAAVNFFQRQIQLQIRKAVGAPGWQGGGSRMKGLASAKHYVFSKYFVLQFTSIAPHLKGPVQH